MFGNSKMGKLATFLSCSINCKGLKTLLGVRTAAAAGAAAGADALACSAGGAAAAAGAAAGSGFGAAGFACAHHAKSQG